MRRVQRTGTPFRVVVLKKRKKPHLGAEALGAAIAFTVAACGSGPDPRPTHLAEGAGSPGPCSTRQLRGDDGLCRCPAEDVLCPTRGFASFTISNAEGSGLPNAVSYDVGPELVVDRVTSLVWQRQASHAYFGWQEAREYCASLELGGRTDFRLPARIELVTILDFARLPVIAAPFADAKADYYFTSSPASFVTGSAYSVYFGAGETTLASAYPGRALARCVAGSVKVSEPQFERDGEFVRDRGTGLVWEERAAAAASWAEAIARCASLELRLPSIRELQSIVDENRYLPAVDSTIFPGAEAAGAWSSSLRGGDPWYVDFSDGKTYADRLPSEALASRCVR